MSIPAFTSHGLLPPGVQDATLAEIGEFLGSTNPRRQELFGKLAQFVDLVRRFACFSALYVDGSFVTSKDSPNDIDVVLELPKANLAAFLAHPNRLALLDAHAVKETYEVHLFIQAALPTSVPDMAYFFQHLRPEEALVRRLPAHAQKGILRIVL